MNDFLILGGSGFVGSALCERLVRRSGGGGGRISVPSRRSARVKHLQTLPTVEVVPADVHDDAELARLVAGRDAVVNLVAILHGSEAEFERAHAALPRRLARACLAAGVARVVHVSALAADVQAPSMYLRSKAAGEAALRQPGLAVTILRPSVIFGAGDSFLNLFARLQAALPVMPLACAGARFQPVWLDDVAEAIVRVLDLPATAGETLECVGPRVYTLAELVRLAGRWSGHERPVLALPAALGRLQARVMEWLPGETLMSLDSVRSMQVPNIASGCAPGLERLGIDATALEAIGPGMLAADGELARLNRWRAAAHRG
jgi:NADH dehydrogenase